MQVIIVVFRLLVLMAWFTQAGIPAHLWMEFATVAACESSLDPNAVGDNGNASGLLQIHWYLWHEWSVREGLGIEDTPHDPVANIQLAYAIQEAYSLPRGNERWEQWAARPDWTRCRYRLAEWLRNG